jgi:hypothetical protein
MLLSLKQDKEKRICFSLRLMAIGFLRFELFGLYFSFLATLLSRIGSDPSFGAYLRGAWFLGGKKEGKPSSLRVFLCSSSVIVLLF